MENKDLTAEMSLFLHHSVGRHIIKTSNKFCTSFQHTTHKSANNNDSTVLLTVIGPNGNFAYLNRLNILCLKGGKKNN